MKKSRRNSGPVPPRHQSQAIKRRTRVALVVLCTIGEAISAYLSYAHHRVHGEPTWSSVCNVGALVNCDAALTSAYAVVAGMPLSLWGAWFYGLLLAALLPAFSSNPLWFGWFPALAFFGATTIAVGISIALAGLSVFELRSVCSLCVTLYLVNVALMLVARNAAYQSGESAVGSWSAVGRSRFLQVLLAVGMLLALLMGRLYSRYSAGGSEVCQIVADTQRRLPGQPFTLEIYSDFQCPQCRALDQQLRGLVARRDIRVVQEHYPLEASCNPDVTTTWHQGACLQARAAICAEAFGAGPSMRERLFAAAPRSLAQTLELASTLGLDSSSFERCVMADEVYSLLKASIARARSLGVRATPTLLINGRKHVGKLSPTDQACLVSVTSP